MKCRNGNFPGGVARVLLASLVLFGCLTLFTESAQAQRPEPKPIQIDTVDVGVPERVELGGGKYKEVFKNKAGQVVREDEYVLGVLVSTKKIFQVYPNGQAAQVTIMHFNPLNPGQPFEIISNDRFGNPQMRELCGGAGGRVISSKSGIRKRNAGNRRRVRNITLRKEDGKMCRRTPCTALGRENSRCPYHR